MKFITDTKKVILVILLSIMENLSFHFLSLALQLGLQTKCIAHPNKQKQLQSKWKRSGKIAFLHFKLPNSQCMRCTQYTRKLKAHHIHWILKISLHGAQDTLTRLVIRSSDRLLNHNVFILHLHVTWSQQVDESSPQVPHLHSL